MAQALAFVFPATFGAGGSLALVTATGLTFGGSILNVGFSLLLNKALAPDQPQAPKPDNIQLNIRQPTGPRIKHYGRVRAGGTIVFFRAKEGKFYRVVVHGHGKIDGIEKYFLDKGEVTLDGSGFVQEAQYDVGGRSRVQILTRDGSDPSTYYSEIEAIWAEYDNAHRLDGLWTSLTIAEQVQPEDFRSTYPNNEPSIEMVARTTAVHDPRSDTTVFSDNAALVIADLIESDDGLGLAGKVNDTQLAVAANDADDDIALAAGGTEKRYRISGSYALNERPGDVLRRMLDVCGGDVQLRPDGTIGIHMGVWNAPSVTLTLEDLLALQSYSSGPDKLDRYTELPFSYVDPDLAYQEVTGDPWVDSDLETAYGAASIGPLQNFTFAPSHGQSRRAAKIMTARDNPPSELVLQLKPRALRALYERVVAVNIPEIGIDANYRVVSFNLNPTDLTTTVQLAEISADAYSWSSSEEGQAQELPTPPSGSTIPTPANFTAAGQGVQISGDSFAAGIAAAWDAPSSDLLTPKLQYSEAGQDEWIDATVPDGTHAASIGGLQDGADYDLRVAFVTPAGEEGAYATQSSITAAADTSAPASPTALTVTDQGGGDALVEFTASTTASIWKTEVFRDGVQIATIYTDPEVDVSFTDSPGAGTYDWTARSINVSGVQNASDAGPVTQTIT